MPSCAIGRYNDLDRAEGSKQVLKLLLRNYKWEILDNDGNPMLTLKDRAQSERFRITPGILLEE
jgi:hypothetical protein